MNAALLAQQQETAQSLAATSRAAFANMQHRSVNKAMNLRAQETGSAPVYGPLRKPFGERIAGFMGKQSAANAIKRPALDASLVRNTYFVQSDKLKATMNNKREVNPHGSDNRTEIIKLLRKEDQSATALNFLETSIVNKKSQAQAETRIKSYKICMTESGRTAWPPTYESLFEFIAASISCPKPYACIDIICSDVMAADTKFDPQDRARINNVLSRLRKKGIIGQKKQKKPISLSMIATLRSKEGEPEKKVRCAIRAALLLAFYGAFRAKECEALVPVGKGDKPPFGYIGISYDDEDSSLHADLSNFVQKGGPRCSRHVRIYCSCCKSENKDKDDLLCLICNKDLRKAVNDITSGYKLKMAVDFLVKSLGSDQCEDQLAPHSCRIGQAVHMFLNDVPIERIIQHARWSDHSMVLYYSRNARKFARPPCWSNFVSWLNAVSGAKKTETIAPIAGAENLDYNSDEDSFCSAEED